MLAPQGCDNTARAASRYAVPVEWLHDHSGDGAQVKPYPPSSRTSATPSIGVLVLMLVTGAITAVATRNEA